MENGEIRSNFSSFPHYFIYIFLTSGVKLHIHLLNVVVPFIVFLTLSTLICRGADISKCFSESLGIRDNVSRLYFVSLQFQGRIQRGIVGFNRTAPAPPPPPPPPTHTHPDPRFNSKFKKKKLYSWEFFYKFGIPYLP